MLTKEELAANRERADKATPGPWIIDRVNGVIWSADGRRVFEIGGYEEPDDHEFFAHAREDIPRLLAEIERLQSVIRGVRSIANEFDYMAVLEYLDGGDAE